MSKIYQQIKSATPEVVDNWVDMYYKVIDSKFFILFVFFLALGFLFMELYRFMGFKLWFIEELVRLVGLLFTSIFEVNHDFLLIPCLLYTSPSPRDRTRSRMPSSA